MKLHDLARSRLAQTVVRAAYPYGSVRTIRRGPLKARRMIVGPGMGYTYIWNMQGHEWDWVRLVGKGQRVYDIGANCGQSTLHLAEAVGPDGAVVAFEPTPDNYRSLVRNVELNALGQVTPVCAAVGAVDGVVQFQFDRKRPTMGRLNSANVDLGDAEVLEVRQLALDSYEERGWPAPSFLKVDVEGGAAGVFAGAHELLKRCRPVIYIEMHSPDERAAVRDLLGRYDYRAFSIDGGPIGDPTAAHLTHLVCRPA